MLRGPQTPGELKQRAERLHPFADLTAVHDALDGLIARELAARLERRPGQKEERYAQLLGAAALDAPIASAETPPAAAAPAPARVEDDRLSRLEAEVAALRAEVRSLREQLGG